MSVFLVVKAIVALGNGLGLVVIPKMSSLWFGISLDSHGVLMARWFGVMMCGMGLICIHMVAEKDSRLRRGLLLSLFIVEVAGLIVAVTGQFLGMMNAFGWMVVATWCVFALGLGYFRFLWKSS